MDEVVAGFHVRLAFGSFLDSGLHRFCRARLDRNQNNGVLLQATLFEALVDGIDLVYAHPVGLGDGIECLAFAYDVGIVDFPVASAHLFGADLDGLLRVGLG